MKLKIIQKYFTVGDKFAIYDQNDNVAFFAEGKIFSIRSKLNLMNPAGVLLYHTEARFAHFLSYSVINNPAGDEIGYIDERLHPLIGFKRARMKIGDTVIKIKLGPIHMKAIVKVDGKWNKKNPAVKSTKQLFHIADTYVCDVDETQIDPALGALVAVWCDRVHHNKSH